jgi:tRNA G18 (ribose-2'-O)-methylase SpoU
VAAVRAIPIHDLADARVALYRNLKDRDLRSRCDAFLVEGRENLACLLLRSQHTPESLLLSARAHRTLGDTLAALPDEVPIYVAERSVLEGIVGFDMYRGVLALCRREHEPSFDDVFPPLAAAGPEALVVVLEGLTNHDNVGGIFRNAEAFGADAALLCPRVCDPLYRKAIRTSMGATLCVPTVRAEVWPAPLEALRAAGFTLVALHPNEDSICLDDADDSLRDGPLALLVGSEGPGLSDAALAVCDSRLRIPMAPGVDSINVATACAIALHHFRRRRA